MQEVMGGFPMIRHSPRKKTGFTLLELAIVLVILSLMVSGIASMATQNTRREKSTDLQKRMDAIETGLMNFRRKNGRLPCPADATLLITSQYFGVETITAGACTNGASYTSGHSPSAAQAANFYDGTNTVAGAVPVKALALPDEYAFDPWGNRFFYAVDKRMTAAAAFTTYSISAGGIGTLTIVDGSGNNRTTTAIALLMSYGPNGHGAYQYNGTVKSFGSTNTNEQANCHCGSDASPNAFTATFYQTPASISPTDPLNGFDDIVRYYMRGSFFDATDLTLSR
jgi:prepilin-type N-terminal cleavage/methylation domain-containing protein